MNARIQDSGTDQRQSRRAFAPAFALAIAAAFCAGDKANFARAQQFGASPVYMADSTAAVDALVRASELVGAGNVVEGATVLQSVLDQDAHLLIADASDPDLYITVRQRVNAAIQSNKELLFQYRAMQDPVARRMLDEEDRVRAVERTRFLTRAGLDATLRLAQEQLENAAFEAAWITVSQLDSHPDRTGDVAKKCAALLRVIGQYAGHGVPQNPRLRERISTMLAAWESQAGVEPAGAPAPAQRPSIESTFTPASEGEAIALEGLLPRPLWSDYVGDPRRLPVVNEKQRGEIPANAIYLDMWPTVSGDTVYVNDGESISAWNRLTLSRKWRRELLDGSSERVGGFKAIDEANTVAVNEPWVVAVIGVPVAAGTVERLVVALSSETGELRWTRRLSDLDAPALEEAALRSHVIIDQSTVVLTAIKDVTRRRLESVYEIGLDLRTGALKWVQGLASAGRLPYGVRPGSTGHGNPHGGMIFRTDRVGAVTCFESATGRVHWARRIAPENQGISSATQPWDVLGPLVMNGRVFVLTPDKQSLVIVDEQTGREVRRLSASMFSGADYLVGLGSWVIGVASQSGLIGAKANDLEHGQNIKTFLLFNAPQSGIRGRVTVAGDSILVPVYNGLRVIRPDAPEDEQVTDIPLDRPGNVISLTSQLIVVDDQMIHTYLLWDQAEAMLRERMKSTPFDPAPAVTYAELSYRAGKADSIVPAVDHALAAIEKDPLSPVNQDHRARLFRALLDMTQPADAAKTPLTLSPEMGQQLIDRLGLSAGSAMERVAFLMTAGRFYESTNQPARAVETYQNILEVPLLARTTYTEGERTVVAERIATDRLSELVRRHGRAVYAGYDAEAERQLASARTGLDPAEVEVIARRYPFATAAVDAWLEAASRYQRQGRLHLSSFALEEGLSSARQILSPNDARIGEVAGRLLRLLQKSGRIEAAADRLENLLSVQPNIRLSAPGETIDAARLLTELRAEVARRDRRPAIGPKLSGAEQILGWALVMPSDPSGRAPTNSVFMKSVEDEIALWRLDGSGRLAVAWGGVVGEMLLRVHDDAAYFSRVITNEGVQDFVFIKRELASGRVLWETPGLRDSLGLLEDLEEGREAGDARWSRGGRVQTPLHPIGTTRAMIFCFDDRTMALVSRVGHIVMFDLASGRQLWKRENVMLRVHDAALAAGFLLVGGMDRVERPASGDELQLDDETYESVVVALDEQTSETLFRQSDRAEVRWVQASRDGVALVGTDDGVLSIDVYRNQVKWRNENELLKISMAVWLLPGRLIIKSDDDLLHQVNVETGAVRPEPLDTRDRLGTGYGTVTGVRFDDHIGFSTRRGVLLYDRSGDLIGVDARTEFAAILPALFGKDYLITVDTQSVDDEETHPNTDLYPIHVYTLKSCKLVGERVVEMGEGAGPSIIAIVDGKLLISSASVTTVVDAQP